MSADNPFDDPPVLPADSVRSRPATTLETRLLGLGIVLLALVLFASLLQIWPDGNPLKIGTRTIDGEVQLLMIVMITGALGSFIHAATSFGDFVGNEKLTRNWLWWYLLKPLIGAALALILYVAFRGGFLSANISSGQINHFGVAALGGMAGMFSKQATDKLSEVFGTLFRTEKGAGDDQRKDSLANERPVIADIEPRRIDKASPNAQVVVKGTNFAKGAVVRINGEQRETEYRSASELQARLLPHDVAKEVEHEITVFNPPPGGGASQAIKFVIAVSSLDAGAQPPDVADAVVHEHDESVDGCDAEFNLATPDEALPPARGGVSTS